MAHSLRLLAWIGLVLSGIQLHAADLMAALPADTWRTVNGAVETVTDGGETRYRWHPEPGQTAMLVLREDHPLFATIRDYEQLRLQYRIHGRISGMNMTAAGIASGPRSYKLHDWLLAGLTTPRDVWRERVVSFSRPDWLPHDPADGPEAARYLRLEALALEPGTWIEFRGMTLTPGLLTLKPDFEMPLTWPTLTRQADGSALYTIRLELANSSGRPTDITATIESQHAAFAVAIQPETGKPGPDPLTATLADVKSGRRAVYTLTAHLPAATEATLAALYAEPLVVRFTPAVDTNASVLWQGEVVQPLPAEARRQVLISDADLGALRARLATDPEAAGKALHAPLALRAADAFLEKRLVRIPTGHPRVRNSWLGDWRPGDFMPEAVNSKTGERQVGTYTADATWTEYLGYTGGALDHLATAYLYTGEERYAQKAIELMGLYAQQYTEIPFYSSFDPAWNAGPAMLCASRMSATSSYGTNWYGKGHCRLLSAIAESPSWTDESRQTVYHRFALPYALELMKFPGQVNNMTDITNRNVLLLGLAFRDAGLVRWALYSDPGLLRRISDLDADGFSSEGRPINYHRAAMEEYLPALVYLHQANLGVELPLQRLEAALLMPYQRATLTGRVPSAGDMGRGGGVSATPLADVLSELLPDSDIHTLGTGHTVHAALRRHAEGTPAADAWKSQLETTPRLFADAGFAILRTGETAATQIMVTLDYGSSRVHNHLDRNSISLSAFGLTYSQGPGSLYNAGTGGYTSHAQRDRLAPFSGHGSLGQNVIMVDQLDQLPAVGERLTWRVDAEVQVAAARVPGVRPGVTHDRYVALIRGVVIMLDHIHSDEEHVYDFLYHNLGTLSLGEGWTASTEAVVLGDAANYDNILNPRQLQGSGPLHLRWQVSDTAGLALWQLPVAGGRVYTGETGMCNPNDAIVPDAAPSLFHRVSGREATFVTVLEPFTDQPRIASIEGAANDGVLIHWVDGSKTTYTMREAIP